MTETSSGSPQPGEVIDRGRVTLQLLHEVGLNPFAVELLVESFRRGLGRALPDNPVAFEWDGVQFQLSVVGEPSHAGVRKALGLPPLAENMDERTVRMQIEVNPAPTVDP